MKRLEEIRKNLKDGEKLLCVEQLNVSGTDEISVDLIICKNEKEQNELYEGLNSKNQSKNYKFIKVTYAYNAENDCLDCI